MNIFNQIHLLRIRGILLRELQKRKDSIPVLIPSWNNPTYVENIVSQLNRYGIQNIIILDNNSQFNKMKELLHDMEETVSIVRLRKNFGPRLLIQSKTLYSVLPNFFILTDPDIELNKNFNLQMIETLKSITNEFGFGKVGFALDISQSHLFRDEKFYIAGRSLTILEWEEQFWKTRIPSKKIDAYKAPIDTTFALYNKKYFDLDNYQDAIRVNRINGKNVSVVHLPWYAATIVSKEEKDFYNQANTKSKISYYGMG